MTTIAPPTRYADPRSANSTPPTIGLMVVDDHPAVRMGLVQMLESQPGFSVESVCINAEAAVSEARLNEIDVAVVDYHLGGRNGLWVCRQLKQLPRPPRVIVYSAFANDHLATCSVVAGADAILNKGGLGAELCDAIRSVARGRRVIPRVHAPIADMLRRRLNDTDPSIFGMLMAGIPDSEIARTLKISMRELASQRDSMLRKLELLPGEFPAPRSPSELDLDRLIPQR